jgi:hypothetical protein
MEMTLRSEVTERTVEVTVDDGVTITSVHNKEMVVTGLTITYVVELGQWVARAVLVHGYRMKQDGTVGRKEDTRLFRWPPSFPGWVVKAAEHYRPKELAPLSPVPTCVLDTEA